MLVAGYIESHPGEALTLRQHLAALRRLFDWPRLLRLLGLASWMLPFASKAVTYLRYTPLV